MATVFERSQGDALNSIEIKKLVLDLVRECQDRGAPIRDSQIPHEKTIMSAVDVLKYRQIIREEKGSYRADPASLDLLDFYANSIAHWTGKIVAGPSAEDRSKAVSVARTLRQAPP